MTSASNKWCVYLSSSVLWKILWIHQIILQYIPLPWITHLYLANKWSRMSEFELRLLRFLIWNVRQRDDRVDRVKKLQHKICWQKHRSKHFLLTSRWRFKGNVLKTIKVHASLVHTLLRRTMRWKILFSIIRRTALCIQHVGYMYKLCVHKFYLKIIQHDHDLGWVLETHLGMFSTCTKGRLFVWNRMLFFILRMSPQSVHIYNIKSRIKRKLKV
jgi:hypothetical protein